MQSWIIVDRQTGRAVFETYNRSTAEAINTARYAVIPAREYLGALNAIIAAGSKQEGRK